MLQSPRSQELVNFLTYKMHEIEEEPSIDLNSLSQGSNQYLDLEARDPQQMIDCTESFKQNLSGQSNNISYDQFKKKLWKEYKGKNSIVALESALPDA